MTNPHQRAEAEVQAAMAIVREELVVLQEWEIGSEEDQGLAAEMLRDVKARYKALDDKRKTITQPMNKALKAVNELFREPKEALERAESILKGKIAGYLERRVAENTAALELAAASETPEEAAAALTTIEHVEAPKGVSVRYKYKAVVFNPDIVPDQFRIPSEAMIQAFTDASVKERGEPTPIAGVKFEKVPIVSSRG